jgi:hypothetical protein
MQGDVDVDAETDADTDAGVDDIVVVVVVVVDDVVVVVVVAAAAAVDISIPSELLVGVTVSESESVSRFVNAWEAARQHAVDYSKHCLN